MESITLQVGGSIISSGDALGQVQFAASAESDGGASRYIVGRIYGEAEGAFNAFSNPASIIFATSAADNLPASGKIKISHEGHILPLLDNTYDLGSPDLRFRDLYVTSEVTSPSGNFDSLFFNTTLADIDQVEGQLNWNDTLGTLDLGLTDTLTTHLGQDVFYRVINLSGGTIYKGQAVYAAGVNAGGQRIEIGKFVADGSIAEVRYIGLLAETLNQGDVGYVTHFGHVRKVDLRSSNTALNPNAETWAAGDILFPDSSTAGGLTKVPPQDTIYTAIVLTDGNNGELLVRITDPGHINDLHDVNTSGVADNNFLVWNSGADYWEPSSGLYYVDGDLGIGNSSPNATLHVYSPTPSGTIFNAEGTQGSLFSVVDNLSGTLMSVNTIAGLPVLEVNSDYSVTAGRFNQNDFVITSSGDIGIGTANPTEKLDIRYPVGGGMALLKSTDITDGLLFGDMAYSTNNSYQGIKHVGMTGTLDYMIMSEGVNTYISSKAGGITVIGAGGNDTNSQIQLKPNSEVVVNENSSNIDFRVESNNNTHMLFIDGITDTVGIGNSTPLYQLDVVGTGNFSGDVYVSGNVGVGTNSPNAVLHAYGSTPSGTVFNVEGTNGSLFSVVDNLSGVLMSVNNNAGLPVFEVYDDDSIIAGRFAQNDFVVSSGGNVGIGTDSPVTKLDVSGVITATGGDSDEWNQSYDWVAASGGLPYVTGVGTANQVAFFNDTDSITSESNLYWDSGNNRLGIGTSSPNMLLHIDNSAGAGVGDRGFQLDGIKFNTGYGAGLAIQPVASESVAVLIAANTSDQANSAKTIFRVTDNTYSTPWLNIVGGGNVGIGTSSPSYKLHVAGDISANANNIYGGGFAVYGDTNNKLTKSGNDFTLSAGQTTTDIHLGYYNGGTLNKVVTVDSSTDRVGILNTAPAYTLDVTGSGRFTSNMNVEGDIYASGNVGIGTSSPDHKLRVVGDARFGNLHIKTSDYGSAGTGKTIYADGAGAGVLGFISTTAFDFSNGSSSRVRIDSTGNVGIGTTNPQYTLDVNGTSNLGGNVIVGGNLTVNGTTISTNVDTIEIQDPIITLGLTSGNIVTNDSYDRGIAMVTNDGTAFMGWDNSADKFVMLASGVATNGSGNYDAGTYGNLQIADLTASGATFDGNVGVGTASPSYTLDVDGEIAATGLQLYDATSVLYKNIYVNGNDIYFNNLHSVPSYGAGVRGNRGSAVGMDSGGINGYLALAAGGSEKVRIATDGKLGIGTTTPSYKLDVAGTTAITPTAATEALILGRNTGYASVKSTASNELILDSDSAYVSLNHYSSDDVILGYGGGNVGIGTATPSYKLDILGGSTSQATVARIKTAYSSLSNNNYALHVDSSSHTSNMTTAGAMAVDVYGGRAFTINGQGNIGIGTNTPTTLLDVSGVITANGGNSDQWNEAYDFIQASGLDGTGAASGVAFWTDSNTLSYDSGLIWDSTNDRLGIGTTSPSEKLHVAASNVGAGTFAEIRNTSTSASSYAGIKLTTNYNGTLSTSQILDNWTGAGVIFQASRDLSTSQGGFNWLSSAGSTMMVLRRASSNNWLGLNTTNPTQTMDIRYPAGGGMALLKSTDTNDGLLFGDMAYSASNNYQGIKHVGHTGVYDYMLLSDGTNTWLSAKDGYSVVISAGGDNTDSQIRVKPDEIVINEQSSSNDFRVESNNNANMLFVDGIADRVGIGTASPSYTLDIQDPTITNLYVQIGSTSQTQFSDLKLTTNTGNGQIFKNGNAYTGFGGANSLNIWDNSGPIAFHPNNTANVMFLSTAGNVGIGTASPSEKLRVYGSVNGNLTIKAVNPNTGTSAYGAVRAEAHNAGVGIFGYADNYSGSRYGLSTGGMSEVIALGSPSGLLIGTAANNVPIVFGNNNTERMRIAAGGNVGIGTTSPSTQLDVIGSGNFTGDVTIDGHLSAATKSFYIDHPTKEGKLQYGSLESPYHGVRLTGRGKIGGGKCVVQLPDYISALVRDDENVNIQLTNYKHSKILYVDDINIANNEFTVKCDSWFGGGKEFFWSFTAVRKDVQELKVEC